MVSLFIGLLKGKSIDNYVCQTFNINTEYVIVIMVGTANKYYNLEKF